jgi:hypothetical protein
MEVDAIIRRRSPTDLITGDFASIEGWKLNGPSFPPALCFSAVDGVSSETADDGIESVSYAWGERAFGSSDALESKLGSFRGDEGSSGGGVGVRGGSGMGSESAMTRIGVCAARCASRRQLE